MFNLSCLMIHMTNKHNEYGEKGIFILRKNDIFGEKMLFILIILCQHIQS